MPRASYPLGNINEFKVPPDEMPRLMTLQPHNTNVLYVLQNITYAKSPYPPNISNTGQ